MLKRANPLLKRFLLHRLETVGKREAMCSIRLGQIQRNVVTVVKMQLVPTVAQPCV